MADAFARVRKIGLTLPGVEESTSYGTAALKLRKKLICRMKEDGVTLVLQCSGFDEKEFLLASEPAIFFETDHYKGWPGVLIRLQKISAGRLHDVLEQAWRALAGEKLLRSYEEARAAKA